MFVNCLVLKIASRCNLNCTYCYMYNKGDNTYLLQPKFMSNEVTDNIINKALEHCVENNLNNFTFAFHGGEPLLCDESFFTGFVQKANDLFKEKSITCDFILQTNGILLTKEWCELFNSLGVRVGISLDGYKEINDKNRIDHKGRGSYDKVVSGLEIAQNELKQKPGVLSVFDISSDPQKYYQNLIDLNLRHFNLLWPHANYEQLPEAYLDTDVTNSNNTLYADWLIQIFDLWYTKKAETKISIVIFEGIINLLLNSSSGNEDFGTEDNRTLVIETNGGIEAVGALKLCGDGFTKNDANIKTHSLSDALNTDLAMVYHKGHKYLNKKCTHCPLVEVCGGGHVHTRYKKDNGFDNVSVYCKDYMKLITHIQNAVYDSLPIQYQEQWEKITYEEVLSYLDNLDMENIDNPSYSDQLLSF